MGDDSNPKKHLIFTYGTLKKNLPNHYLIQTLISSSDAVFLGRHTTLKPYPLVIGPYGIPYLINLPGSGHKIRGELYSVSGYGLEKLDELEGVEIGHYKRAGIEIDGEDGEVEAYFAGKEFAGKMWEKKGRVGIEEYSEVEAVMYLRKELRPEGVGFLEAIQAFIV